LRPRPSYEQAKEYPLTRREKPGAQLNWRVEKMKLIKVGTRSTASPSSSAPNLTNAPASAPTASIIYNGGLESKFAASTWRSKGADALTKDQKASTENW